MLVLAIVVYLGLAVGLAALLLAVLTWLLLRRRPLVDVNTFAEHAEEIERLRRLGEMTDVEAAARLNELAGV